MKIAVTGASGFVGRHVLDVLRTRGVEVVAVTRNISNLANTDPSIKIVEMDISRPGADYFKCLGFPDVLIHLAWGGLPNYKSLHHFETELPCQYQFLKSMVENGLPSLLVTGTCFEYGMQSGPLCENMHALPNNPYGLAKNALCRQLQLLKATRPFNLTWARLFYMHGDGQAASSLYPELQEAARRGDEKFNMSGGEQLRDYLPVTEVADYLVQLALINQDIGIVNVCSGEPISVRRLVEQWCATHGWSISLNLGYYPYPDYEPMAFWGCRSQLNTLLNQQ